MKRLSTQGPLSYYTLTSTPTESTSPTGLPTGFKEIDPTFVPTQLFDNDYYNDGLVDPPFDIDSLPKAQFRAVSGSSSSLYDFTIFHCVWQYDNLLMKCLLLTSTREEDYFFLFSITRSLSIFVSIMTVRLREEIIAAVCIAGFLVFLGTVFFVLKMIQKGREAEISVHEDMSEGTASVHTGLDRIHSVCQLDDPCLTQAVSDDGRTNSYA